MKRRRQLRDTYRPALGRSFLLPTHGSVPVKPNTTREFKEAGVVLTTCDDGSYCCGVRADDCCDAGRGYNVDPSNGQIIVQNKTRSATSTTSSSSTSSTAAPATTTSSATAATAGAAETGANALPSPIPASDGLSGGAKAGIAIGAVAGVAIIAGLAFLLSRERRKRKALAESEKQPLPGYDNGYYPSASSPAAQLHHQPIMAPSELGAYGRNEHKYHYHSEMGDGQGRPSELHP
ncbi:MAG: hypothetical protein Q9221_001487 [Calogaya cf. arnoldii]